MTGYGELYRHRLMMRAQRRAIRYGNTYGYTVKYLFDNGYFKRLVEQEYINAGASHLLPANNNRN